jgi:hypothetical protein
MTLSSDDYSDSELRLAAWYASRSNTRINDEDEDEVVEIDYFTPEESLVWEGHNQ